MTETTGLRVLARELLSTLPRLVGADAGRMDHEIRQALAAPGDEALRRLLAADDRLATWVRARLGGEDEYRALPSGYQAPTNQMLPAGLSGATLFTCQTADCSAPDSFLRRNLRQQVPYCRSCHCLLSKAPS
ncbi:hypothetical protein ACIP10_14250 [Streptomyces galbus]|uniref:hypothetical protein n=1 Tax=Streptomyces galbus TaxID=33898 RepID=UPI003792B520